MPNPTKLFQAASEAEDTFDLLNHIGWTDVIKPKLEEVKRTYATMLANSILKVPTSLDLTPEVLAARIYGINFIADLFTDILRKGQSAIEFIDSKR